MKKLLLLPLLCVLFATAPSTLHAQTGKVAALESLGMLAGHSAYNTYIAIGSIADGYSCDVYTSSYVQELMVEQVDMLYLLDSSMITLLNSGFVSDEEDQASILQVREIYRLLINQANALKSYAISGSTEDADYFQVCRKKSWAAVSKLIGAEE
jgi:hypothetical protein